MFGIGICLLFGAWCFPLPAYAIPQRIISTMPSITETLFALGVGDRVAGVTLNCNYPEEAKAKEKIGGMTVNLEKIISLKPDLIIMLEDAQKYDAWRLKQRELPVISVNPHTIDEVLESILYIGDQTGATGEAKRLTSYINYRIQKVGIGNKYKPRQQIFVAVGYKPLVTVGEGTFIDDILEKAGGDNVINSKIAYPQINFEELYKLNPEVIIIPEGLLTEKEIKNDSKLARLSAVQNGRMLWVNPDILFRPGPRVADAVERISQFLGQ